MISLIELSYRGQDPVKPAKTREVLAGITIVFILVFQVALVVWALLKEWHL